MARYWGADAVSACECAYVCVCEVRGPYQQPEWGLHTHMLAARETSDPTYRYWIDLSV